LERVGAVIVGLGAGLPFPDESAEAFVGGNSAPGFDEALIGVELFGAVDVAGGDVVPRFGDGVVEVMPADLREEEGLLLFFDEGEEFVLDGVPGLVELGDGGAGFFGELVVAVHGDVIELVPESGAALVGVVVIPVGGVGEFSGIDSFDAGDGFDPSFAERFGGEKLRTDAEDVDIAAFGECGHVGDVGIVGVEPGMPIGRSDDAAPFFGTGLVEEDDGHEHGVDAFGLGVFEDAFEFAEAGDVLPDDGDGFGFHIVLAGGDDEVDPGAAHFGEFVDGFEIAIGAVGVGELDAEAADLVGPRGGDGSGGFGRRFGGVGGGGSDGETGGGEEDEREEGDQTRWEEAWGIHWSGLLQGRGIVGDGRGGFKGRGQWSVAGGKKHET